MYTAITQDISKLIGSATLAFLLLSGPFVLHAATLTVSPGHNIQNAINSANPGDTIIVKNGTYNTPTLNLSRSGNSGSPITIRSESPGGAKLIQAIINITGNYWIFENFHLEGVRVRSNSGTWANTAIEIINGGSNNIIRENRFSNVKGVGINGGAGNIIERNTMEDIDYSAIYVDNSNDTVVRFNRIIRQHGGMGLFVGNGGNAPRLRFEYNHVADGDNYKYGELVAIKSDDARLYGNYFTNNGEGELVIRHNDRAVVECNEFIDNRGIGTNGSGHIIRNNYFFGNSDQHGGKPAIGLGAGDHEKKQKDLSDYQAAHEAIVENNTVVNWQNSELDVGRGFGKNQRNNGYSIPMNIAPRNVKITANIFYDPDDNAAMSVLNTASPGAQWSNNIVWAGNHGDTPSGVTVADPKMQRASDGRLRSTTFPNAGYQGCNVPRNPLDVGARWTGSTGWTVLGEVSEIQNPKNLRAMD